MKIMIVCTIAIASLLLCTRPAEARLFEPQPHWWSSGRSCMESRDPPGLAWDSLPPRACVVREQMTSFNGAPDAGFAIIKAKAQSAAHSGDKEPAKV